MRESDQERRDRLRSYRRSSSPVVRTNWEGRVPYRGESEDDWTVVSPRRRKALRQGYRGQDRQREIKWHRDWADYDSGHSRFRDRREDYKYEEVRDLDRLRDVDKVQRRDGYMWEEERRGPVQKVLRRVAICVRKIDSKTQKQTETIAADCSSQQLPKARRVAICVRKIDSNKQKQIETISADSSSQQLQSTPSTTDLANGSIAKRFVTFYFTNFPAQLSNFYLRKGFEVCGILEEVLVPSKRNVYGAVYGFVRYSNVKDVNKLLKAVNEVRFGNFRVFAKVARFGRSAVKVAERTDVVKGVKGVVLGKKEGGTVLEKVEMEGGVDGPAMVNVGDVRVPLQKGAVKVNEMVGQQTSRSLEGRLQSNQKLLRMYRSIEEDLLWARNGCTASVINGEIISVVQNRILDAGFEDLTVISMGADRVFLFSSSNIDVLQVLEGAHDFFAHFFSNIQRWNKEVVSFQRGAWLRLYGIPLHAWNESFFKLCVFDCGRLLRSDSVSLDKSSFDFARVLVATTSLEVVNCVEKLVIDGQTINIKIVEEWGYNLGEDACLIDTEDGLQSTHSENDVCGGEVEHLGVNADFLVDKIVKELADSNLDDSHEQMFDVKADAVEINEQPVATAAELSPLGTLPVQLYVDEVGIAHVEEHLGSAVPKLDAVCNGAAVPSGPACIGAAGPKLADVCHFEAEFACIGAAVQSGPTVPSGSVTAVHDVNAVPSGPAVAESLDGPSLQRSADLKPAASSALSAHSGTFLATVPDCSTEAETCFPPEIPLVLPQPVCVDSAVLHNCPRLQSSSCPLRPPNSSVSGPWSLEWLQDLHHGEAGIVSSSRKKLLNVVQPLRSVTKSKKVNGILRHPVHNLKKVARLPEKDRSAVLKILKKKVRQRQGSNRLKKSINVVSQNISEGSSSSSASVTKDWTNWIVMHGNEKVAMEDVWGIGKAIGVPFNGDFHNMYGVLARKRSCKGGEGCSKGGEVFSEGGGGR